MTQAATKILVVDDERVARISLAEILRMEGYEVAAAEGGETAILLLKAQEFDVVLCDLKMPDVGGLEVLAACQQFRPATEFILLTAYGTLDTAVSALRHSASDYLLKPAVPETILKSVARALDKRRSRLQHQSLMGVLANTVAALQQADDANAVAPPVRVLDGGGITLNLDRRQVWLNDSPLSLTPTEFDLLAYLMDADGEPISAEELVAHVQGYRADPDEARALIRVHVSRLRQKLERDPADPTLVVTVRGLGYAFHRPHGEDD